MQAHCYNTVRRSLLPMFCFALLQDRKEKDSFFNWFYFAINLGSFLAVTTLVYIQESVSWTIGFAIPAAAMLLAVVTFVAGSSKYVHVEPTERYMGSASIRIFDI